MIGSKSKYNLKIYILPVKQDLQPTSTDCIYPNHNKDYGVEQDFLIWLNRNQVYLTTNPDEADWHYLPVFWTRWHINHNFADNGAGIIELELLLKNVIINDEKTFTITQFDGGTLVNLGKTIEFTAAKTINKGIDIPILCELHKIPLFPIKKKYKATFNGSFDTHPLRKDIYKQFKSDEEVNIGGNLPTRFYTRWVQGKQFNLNILASYISLCPRGTSANSFRFYESMQLGVAPCLIGEIDTRPFQKFINWDRMSYFAKNIHDLKIILDNLDPEEASNKGKEAKIFFKSDLFYQKWCKYVIMELEDIKVQMLHENNGK